MKNSEKRVIKINKNKKSQAALEFLTTYGWAFLVLLLMISALAYFGILSPSKLLPSRCNFGTEIGCKDYTISGNGIGLRLSNNIGEPIIINALTVGTESKQLNCGSSMVGTIWNSGEIKDIPIICDFTNAGLVDGEKGKLKIKLSYHTALSSSSFSRDVNGEIYAIVGSISLNISSVKLVFVCDVPLGAEYTCDALFNYITTLGYDIARINGPATSLSQFTGYDVAIDDSYAWNVNARGDSSSILWQYYQNGGKILIFGNDNGGPDVVLSNSESSCNDETIVLRNLDHPIISSVQGQTFKTGGDWHLDSEPKNFGEVILGDQTNCPSTNSNDPGLIALQGPGRIVSAIAYFDNNPIEQSVVRNSIIWLLS